MVDVLSDLEVIRLLAVPWIRAETTAGISSKGRITGRGIRNPEMEPLCPEIASYPRFKGPIRTRPRRYEQGCRKFPEINPRTAGESISDAGRASSSPKLTPGLIDGTKLALD
jgi:hypothetical protein